MAVVGGERKDLDRPAEDLLQLLARPARSPPWWRRRSRPASTAKRSGSGRRFDGNARPLLDLVAGATAASALPSAAVTEVGGRLGTPEPARPRTGPPAAPSRPQAARLPQAVPADQVAARRRPAVPAAGQLPAPALAGRPSAASPVLSDGSVGEGDVSRPKSWRSIHGFRNRRAPP